ncbi:hypothetical protein R3P38DRAFT_1737220 [Favolaschia claudopus]|uniref:NACHT domain-containing protein n=1 Tax=Favolaschia claudopus TaxID=2862362 RepID=A0AAW0DFJ9_9AGAR
MANSTIYHIINNISGGIGGPGGGSGLAGGAGGLGEGPVINNYNLDTKELSDAAALRVLHAAAANEASHDSAESRGRPPCHRDTRTEYLFRLTAWSCRNERNILWMHGPAGTGKSAIAQSFCEQLQAEGRLGGSFFFKRDHISRRNGMKLFPTLAYQLAVTFPEFRAMVTRNLAKDPGLLTKSAAVQLHKLILEPYQDSALNQSCVLIIDGLDECESEDFQVDILRCLRNVTTPLLHILIASRPEPHIRTVVLDPSGSPWDSLEIQGSFEDIQLFFRDEFKRIHQTHEAMRGIAHTWPPYEAVNTFVYHSSGHFIYAATVIRFIEDPDWNPRERLDIILGLAEPDPLSSSPFAALDQLYMQILVAIPNQTRLLHILPFIAAGSHVSHNGLSIAHLTRLINIEEDNVRLTLRRMRSLIYVPPSAQHGPVTVYHTSFLDFLRKANRSGPYYFDHIARNLVAQNLLRLFCEQPIDKKYPDPLNHITRDLEFRFLFSTRLSSDLISLLRRVNLDLIFPPKSELPGPQAGVQNAPKDLLDRWKDLSSLARLHEQCASLVDDVRNSSWQFMSSPRTFKVSGFRICGLPRAKISFVLNSQQIIHAYIAMAYIVLNMTSAHNTIFYIRWAFDLSWEEITRSIGPLQDIIKRHGKGCLLEAACRPDQIRAQLPNKTLESIAKRCLQIASRDLYFRDKIKGWSCILRACLPSQDLFDAVCAFVEHWKPPDDSRGIYPEVSFQMSSKFHAEYEC